MSTVKLAALKVSRGRWNHNGPEGKELRQDVIEGAKNGTLNIMAPDCTGMFNAKPLIYGKFSKGFFRVHCKEYVADYERQMKAASSSGGVGGLAGK